MFELKKNFFLRISSTFFPFFFSLLDFSSRVEVKPTQNVERGVEFLSFCFESCAREKNKCRHSFDTFKLSCQGAAIAFKSGRLELLSLLRTICFSHFNGLIFMH